MAADWDGYLNIYAPQREGQLDMMNPTEGFVEDSLISPGAVFMVRNARYDASYIVTSIGFARRLFGQQGMLSQLELRLKPGSDLDAVKAEMREIAGKKYRVMDRMEQQADTFKIMKIEKFIAYIFLTFILAVACFNIIGSLSMLIIDKKNDVVTLRNMGATDKQITRIFLFEGRMISVIGAVIGILLGLLLCWLQQEYGLVAPGTEQRLVRCRRLSGKRTPGRHHRCVPNSGCRGICLGVVSREVFCQEAALKRELRSKEVKELRQMPCWLHLSNLIY